jgi:hypothetical protein
MKNLKIWTILLSASFILLSSCKKDDDNGTNGQPSDKGTMILNFDHGWGPMHLPFSLNTALIHPASQEEITFTKLRYYVSNIILHKANGEEWIEAESYRIVTVPGENPKVSLEVKEVPVGEYSSITYMIGVDEARNTSGAQSGALSPSEGMFWSWTTGYIFIKAEGMSPVAPFGQFMYHIGGFEGANNAIRTTNLNFGGNNLSIKEGRSARVNIKVNSARFWHGGISLGDISAIHMPGPNAVTIADNFIGAFSFDSID